jgi:phospholipid/cholesterol/gamma-HCH transport system ATP-binding protein
VSGGPLLETRDLAVGHVAGEPVLAGVDLRIDRREIVALLGPSGCGKSTLLRAFAGLQAPQAGELNLFGESLYGVTGERRDQLLRRTGTVFQHDALFGSMSVRDNVALPLRETTRLPRVVINEMVAMKLGLVGLAGLEERCPAQLSGGQRKRAALARATILDPELVFCDEPSAGLDPAVAAGIDDTFLRLRDIFGITFVLVTHELDSIRAIADRAVMFDHGGIVAAGTIAELTDSPDPSVHAFFHRVHSDRIAQDSTR